MSNITKGNNNNSKEGRVVILIRNTLSCPDLQLYKVPSKYSEGYSSYRAYEKSISKKIKGNNSESKQARELSFLYATLRLVLFTISTKYHKKYSKGGHEINRLSLPNITKGDNAKSKKGKVVFLVRDTPSCPVLHFCQVPSKYSKGYSSYRAKEKSIADTKSIDYHCQI